MATRESNLIQDRTADCMAFLFRDSMATEFARIQLRACKPTAVSNGVLVECLVFCSMCKLEMRFDVTPIREPLPAKATVLCQLLLEVRLRSKRRKNARVPSEIQAWSKSTRCAIGFGSTGDSEVCAGSSPVTLPAGLPWHLLCRICRKRVCMG